MEQRRLRLGDILDDYCPRERRVTNHAVVAMIDEHVKQTRCTTCDAEHVYKGGKAPRRRKAQATDALYKEVLAGGKFPDAEPVAGATPRDAAPPREPEHLVEPDDMPDSDSSPDSLAASELDELDLPEDDDSQATLLPPDEGPVHRPLIRAQLPRPEGLKIERQAPEFTIRQNNGRGGGGGFRGRGQGGNGNAPGNTGQRFGRGPHRGGSGRGPNQGFGRGAGSGQPRQGGPRKRSR
jgi:hypothetical protein